MKNFLALSRVGRGRLFTSDTHKSIKRLIDAVPKRQPVSIVNIDFHHDYYHFFRGGNYLNCGNWLRRVLEERPETRVKWIRREDSQIHSLEGEVPFEHTTELQSIFHRYYDLVFICRSFRQRKRVGASAGCAASTFSATCWVLPSLPLSP